MAMMIVPVCASPASAGVAALRVYIHYALPVHAEMGCKRPVTKYGNRPRLGDALRGTIPRARGKMMGIR